MRMPHSSSTHVLVALTAQRMCKPWDIRVRRHHEIQGKASGLQHTIHQRLDRDVGRESYISISSHSFDRPISSSAIS